jgi:hypothetical protein
MRDAQDDDAADDTPLAELLAVAGIEEDVLAAPSSIQPPPPPPASSQPPLPSPPPPLLGWLELLLTRAQAWSDRTFGRDEVPLPVAAAGGTSSSGTAGWAPEYIEQVLGAAVLNEDDYATVEAVCLELDVGGEHYHTQQLQPTLVAARTCRTAARAVSVGTATILLGGHHLIVQRGGGGWRDVGVECWIPWLRVPLSALVAPHLHKVLPDSWCSSDSWVGWWITTGLATAAVVCGACVAVGGVREWLRWRAVDQAHYAALSAVDAFLVESDRADSAAVRALRLLQEVELVSRGYRVGRGALPPVSRLERQTQARTLPALRLVLHRGLAACLHQSRTDTRTLLLTHPLSPGLDYSTLYLAATPLAHLGVVVCGPTVGAATVRHETNGVALVRALL